MGRGKGKGEKGDEKGRREKWEERRGEGEGRIKKRRKLSLLQTVGFIFNNILPGCDYHQTSDRNLFELFRAICTVIICLLIRLLATLIQKSSLPWSCYHQG